MVKSVRTVVTFTFEEMEVDVLRISDSKEMRTRVNRVEGYVTGNRVQLHWYPTHRQTPVMCDDPALAQVREGIVRAVREAHATTNQIGLFT